MLCPFRNLQKIFNVQWPWHSSNMLPTIVNGQDFCICNLTTPYRESTPYASPGDAHSSYVGFGHAVTSPAFGAISKKLKFSSVLLVTINNLQIDLGSLDNESSYFWRGITVSLSTRIGSPAWSIYPLGKMLVCYSLLDESNTVNSAIKS